MASSVKKHIDIKVRVQTPYAIYDQNSQNQLKSIPHLWPKRLKNHTFWGCTYLYSPYKGVTTPGSESQPKGCLKNVDIQDKIFKSKNGLCISLHNRLLQDHMDPVASKEPKNPISARILHFLCLVKIHRICFYIWDSNLWFSVRNEPRNRQTASCIISLMFFKSRF